MSSLLANNEFVSKAKPPRWFLPEWLDFLDVTQEDLAARMNTSKGYLSEIMTGKRRYNESTLGAIAFALGREEWEILGVNPHSPKPVEKQLAKVWDDLTEEQRQTFLDLGQAMAVRNRAPKP